MGTTRTAWHVILAALLSQRGSRSFEYRSEVPLSSEPLRGDFLLLHREGALGPDPSARTLRRLWDLLPKDTILEFKSVGRPYRSRNLHRLLSYLFLYYADQIERVAEPADLCGVLLVAARTPSLYADALALGLRWRDLGDGYARIEGAAFALYVVEIDVAADAEDDDLLRLLGHGGPRTSEGQRWLAEQIGSEKAGVPMEQMEAFEELVAKIVAKLPPEEGLGGFCRPRSASRGLTPEEQLLLLPVETLRALSDAYIRARLSGACLHAARSAPASVGSAPEEARAGSWSAARLQRQPPPPRPTDARLPRG